MKRFLTAFLATLLLLGLVACGTPSDPQDTYDSEGETDLADVETEPTETESGPFYAYSGSSIEENKEIELDGESYKVTVSNTAGGFGDANVLKAFLTPRNMGKLGKIEAYVMPTSENAAFRMTVSKKNVDSPLTSAYFFNLRANEWNKITLCYPIAQENVDAGYVSVHIDQNISGADNALQATLCDVFYVDKVKFSLFKETESKNVVHKLEGFEDAKGTFTQYAATSYETLTDTANEFKMDGNFDNAALKVGAWNWNARSGNKSMTLYNLAPNGSGSFDASVKLNNLLPNDLTPYIGSAIKISAYVLMEGFSDPSKPISASFGFMGDKTTSQLVFETHSVKAGEWTLLECELLVTEDFLKQDALIFDNAQTTAHYPVRPFVGFGSDSTNYPTTVYIDDFVVEYVVSEDIRVTLPSIFADNMVLQRDKKVPIWGWDGVAGDVITATIGEYSASATVDSNGEFFLELPEMKAATEQVLTIKNGAAAISFENVGIGEVWYCSGQSNMELKIKSVHNVEDIIASASKYDVRSFKVTSVASYTLQKDVTNGRWEQVTASNVSSMSAIAYLTAYQLQAELGVPVAIIESYNGGSSAQAWLDYDVVFAEDRADIYNNKKWIPKKSDGSVLLNNYGCEGRTMWEDYNFYWQIGTANEGKLIAKGSQGSTSNRFAPTGFYNGTQGPLAGYAIAGVMWYQGESRPNSFKSEQYNYVLYDLIEQWRRDFRDEELPVVLFQLAPYSIDEFKLVRQVQLDTAKRMDHVYAVTLAYEGYISSAPSGGHCLDLDRSMSDGWGNAIHPGTKRPVADRAAYTILSNEYGMYEKYAAYLSPEYQSMTVNGNVATLTFSNATGLKIRDGDASLTGFRAYAANGSEIGIVSAKIQGATVVITTKEGTTPAKILYAYENASEKQTVSYPSIAKKDGYDPQYITVLSGNLENGMGQPAFPFAATLGDAKVHAAKAVNGKLNVEIWELGHNTTTYQVAITVNGVTKTYDASFQTAGNFVVETDISATAGASAQIVIGSNGKTLQTVTVEVK